MQFVIYIGIVVIYLYYRYNSQIEGQKFLIHKTFKFKNPMGDIRMSDIKVDYKVSFWNKPETDLIRVYLTQGYNDGKGQIGEFNNSELASILVEKYIYGKVESINSSTIKIEDDFNYVRKNN
jgi:hypothetical protein